MPPSDHEKQPSLARPSDRAEEMFADDPEMLAMIAKARAEKDPVRRSWTWLVLLGLFGVLGLGVNAGAIYLMYRAIPHPLVFVSGLLGGMVLFMGLVGHRPGRYKWQETGEEETLWVPLGTLLRLGAIVAGPAIAAGGAVLNL